MKTYLAGGFPGSARRKAGRARGKRTIAAVPTEISDLEGADALVSKAELEAAALEIRGEIAERAAALEASLEEVKAALQETRAAL